MYYIIVYIIYRYFIVCETKNEVDLAFVFPTSRVKQQYQCVELISLCCILLPEMERLQIVHLFYAGVI